MSKVKIRPLSPCPANCWTRSTAATVRFVVAQMETEELREFYVEHKMKRYERLDVAELEAEVENLGGRLP